MARKLRLEYPGAIHHVMNRGDRRETSESVAEALVREELKRRTWDEAELAKRAKGDRGKVAIAVRLRQESTMTARWIAEHLQMGTLGHVNHLLYRNRKRGEKKRS